RERPIAAPLRMNSGIESSVMLAISSNTFWVIVSVAAAGMNINMNSTAMVPRAKAIGMPENITTRVPSPYKIPMVDSAILFLLANDAGDQLQQDLQRQQGHADSHEAVGNPQRWRPR